MLKYIDAQHYYYQGNTNYNNSETSIKYVWKGIIEKTKVSI